MSEYVVQVSSEDYPLTVEAAYVLQAILSNQLPKDRFVVRVVEK